MQVKEYLKQYKALKAEIATLQGEISEIMAMAERVTPRYGIEPPGGGAEHDKIGAVLAKAEWYEREFQDRISEAMTLIVEISALIDEVPDREHQRLLSMRYIECMRWERIADELGMSVRTVFYAHGEALKEAQKIFEKDERWHTFA